MTRQNHNPPDWNYEPAPVEESLRQARLILQRLHGMTGTQLENPTAPFGPCDDCGRDQERFEYGKFRVCRTCALRRLRPGIRKA
jgi:hypothetical protein